jgi:tetratricopeptide (TPR) repeat protein
VNVRSTVVAAVAAIVAGAAWPWFAAQRAQATAPPSAPVNTDYLQRDRLIAFDEGEVRNDPENQIAQRLLASQYMLRFRESGDFGDVARAQAMARRSLQLQPSDNLGALGVLASADLAYHRFDAALADERAAVEAEPSFEEASVQIASVLMELGRYGEADRTLVHAHGPEPNPMWMSVRARYNELTGNLAGARVEMTRAQQMIDRMIMTPAYSRSWYHVRSAQLAFEDGDAAAAEAEYTEALRIFPGNAMALLYQAKYYRAHCDWQRALDAATRSADLYPLPQALGYEADAQRALGDVDGARRTDALIRAEQRIYNTQGVNDRLLAMYYAEHNEHLSDALAAARSDLTKRGNEIYADDTMAWVLAAMGRWPQARLYAQRAIRYGTQDPEIQYHAGVIALRTGNRDEARRRLQAALDRDPQFHPWYADDARRMLALLAK